MRTIKVTGKANLKVKPNQTKICLVIKGFSNDYAETLSKSAEYTKIISDVINSCGIDRNELKTENFYTSEKTTSIRDQYGNTTYKFIGYDVNHYMNFKFYNDNEKLGKVLYQLSKLDISPRITVKYVVDDAEEYKTQLISIAVNDARRKALAMTSSANVELGDIIHMNYSYNTITWESRDYLSLENRMMFNASEKFDVDFNPEYANLSDSVTIAWEIK